MDKNSRHSSVEVWKEEKSKRRFKKKKRDKLRKEKQTKDEGRKKMRNAHAYTRIPAQPRSFSSHDFCPNDLLEHACGYRRTRTKEICEEIMSRGTLLIYPEYPLKCAGYLSG